MQTGKTCSAVTIAAAVVILCLVGARGADKPAATEIEKPITASECGIVNLEFKSSKTAHTNLVFKSSYSSSPLVMVCESGSAGAWVIIKAENITKTGCVVCGITHNGEPANYTAKVAYIIVAPESMNPSAPKDESKPEDIKSGQRDRTRPKDQKPGSPQYAIITNHNDRMQTDISLIVESSPTTSDLHDILMAKHQEARRQKTGTLLKVFIDVFASKEHYRSGCGLWLAQLRYNNLDSAPVIKIDEEALAALTEPSTIKMGMTTDQRKAAFLEYWECELEARKRVATTSPPMPDPMSAEYVKSIESRDKRYDSLCKRLLREWKKKHGFDDDQVDTLLGEGIAKKWLHPPMDERYLW